MVNRPYEKLRLAVERFGGSMEWVRAGSPHGSWLVRIGRWSQEFQSAGGSFPGLDDLYIPLRQTPRGFRDYANELIPGAMGTFIGSIVDEGKKSTRDWTVEEVECLIFCYFWMLDQEAAGNSFNKAALYRAVARDALTVNKRGVNAVERKCMNVSAVLYESGFPFVTGLAPDRNYQILLRKRVLAELERRGFVQAADFEPTADDEQLQKRVDSLLQLRKLGRPRGRKRPKKAQAYATQYQRSSEVAAWVLQQAEGICCLCNQPAPFARPDGAPYLEVHHITPLGQGGSDTVENAVALCPNCHREVHHGTDSAVLLEKLHASVEWLNRN